MVPDCLRGYGAGPKPITVSPAMAALSKVAIVSADVDNDTWPDLVVATRGTARGASKKPQGRIFVLWGPFGEDHTPAAMWSSAEQDDFASLSLGDVNDDGILDIAASVYALDGLQTYAARVFLSTGPRSWAQAFAAPAAARSPTVAFGDADRDGDLDLFVGAVQLDGTDPLLTATQVLYLNRGESPYFAANQLIRSEEGVDAFASRFVDFDLDGALDVLVSQPGTVWGVLYRGATLRRPEFFQVGGEPNRAFAVQFDLIPRGALPPSVVVAQNAHYCSGVYCFNRVFEAEGPGCAPAWERRLGASMPAAVRSADLNGDGWTDAITALWTGDPRVPSAGPVGAYCGTAQGLAPAMQTLEGAGFRTQNIAIGDLDRRGIEVRTERWGAGHRAIPPGATALTLSQAVIERVLSVEIDGVAARTHWVPGTQWVSFSQPLWPPSRVEIRYESSNSLDLVIADFTPGMIPVFYKE